MGTRVGVPAPGDRVAQRYELTRQIGSGAAGVVFEAAHVHIGRRVALKWLYPHLAADPVGARRFLNEARAACLIDHPNVIDVFDAGPDRDSLFLVMELLEGEPLSERMRRGFTNHGDFIDLLLPALRGVDAAHRAGIIHRDLKPENIFLARSRPGRPGAPKVLDFGISKLHERREGLTHAGSFVGSPFYMAPEQVTDASTVDARVDIYAVGVILYEGLSGQLPFESESLTDLFYKVTRDKPVPLDQHRPNLPSGLVRAIHRAMASTPDARFKNVTSLAIALEPYASSVRFLADEDAPTLAAPYPRVDSHRIAGAAKSDRLHPPWSEQDVERNVREDATVPDHPFLDGAATIADGDTPFESDAGTSPGPAEPAPSEEPNIVAADAPHEGSEPSTAETPVDKAAQAPFEPSEEVGGKALAPEQVPEQQDDSPADAQVEAEDTAAELDLAIEPADSEPPAEADALTAVEAEDREPLLAAAPEAEQSEALETAQMVREERTAEAPPDETEPTPEPPEPEAPIEAAALTAVEAEDAQPSNDTAPELEQTDAPETAQIVQEEQTAEAPSVEAEQMPEPPEPEAPIEAAAPTAVEADDAQPHHDTAPEAEQTESPETAQTVQDEQTAEASPDETEPTSETLESKAPVEADALAVVETEDTQPLVETGPGTEQLDATETAELAHELAEPGPSPAALLDEPVAEATAVEPVESSADPEPVAPADLTEDTPEDTLPVQPEDPPLVQAEATQQQQPDTQALSEPGETGDNAENDEPHVAEATYMDDPEGMTGEAPETTEPMPKEPLDAAPSADAPPEETTGEDTPTLQPEIDSPEPSAPSGGDQPSSEEELRATNTDTAGPAEVPADVIATPTTDSKPDGDKSELAASIVALLSSASRKTPTNAGTQPEIPQREELAREIDALAEALAKAREIALQRAPSGR